MDVLTPIQVSQIAKSVVTSFKGLAGGITPLNNKGKIDYEYFDQMMTSGNLRGWATPEGTPPSVPAGTYIFQFAGPGTYENYPDGNGDPIELTEAVNIITWDGEKATAAPFEVDLIDYAKQADVDDLTKIPTLVPYSVTMTQGSVDILDGSTHGGEVTYKKTDFIPVIPGSRIRVTLAIGGNRAQNAVDDDSYVRGICGYDINKTYNTIPDDSGLLEGELFSKDRYAAISKTTSNYNTAIFENYIINIPKWCYWVRGCSRATGSLATDFVIEVSVYDENSQPIKEIVETIEPQVKMPSVKLLAPEMLSNTYVVTSSNNADPGDLYGINNFSASDKIPAVAGDKFSVTLVCVGLIGGTEVTSCNGICAYDANDNFVKVIWDNNIADSLGLYGRTDGARKKYTNIEFEIVDDVEGAEPIAYIRGSSGTSGTTPTSPFIISQYINDPELLQNVVDRHVNDIALLKKQVRNNTDERRTVTQLAGKYVVANTGGIVTNASWAMVEYPVNAGEQYKVTSVCSGFSGETSSQKTIIGIAGFDIDGNFLSEIGSNGHPIGELWSNDIAALSGLYGRTDGARKLYTKQLITIPEGCTLIRIATGIAGSGSKHDVELYYVNNDPITLQEQVGYNTYDIQQLKGDGGGGSSANIKSIMQNEVERIIHSQVLGHRINPNSGIGSSKLFKRFTFGVVTDIHNNSLNALNNLDEAISFLGRPTLSSKIDGFFSLGDLCNGSAGRTKSTTINEIRGVISRMTASPWPGMSLIGNHDTNVNEAADTNPTSTFANCLTKEDQYTEIVYPFLAKNSNLHLVENKGYFYYDNEEFKIRIIALDAYDHPYSNAGDGTLTYTVGFLYSQAQLNWFAETLASIPEDYGLIMFTHEPHVPGWEGGVYRQGTDLIPGIVEAYKNGSTFSKSWAGDGTYPELATSISVNFTSRGPSEVIIWLCGHAHTRKVLTYKGTTQVVQHCLFTETKEAGATIVPPQYVNKGDTDDTMSSWHIWSIDRDQRKVYGVCYGAFEDADGDFITRRMIIDY